MKYIIPFFVFILFSCSKDEHKNTNPNAGSYID